MNTDSIGAYMYNLEAVEIETNRQKHEQVQLAKTL